MSRGYFHLHLVSDTTEKTLAAASRAASSLYPGVSTIEHVHSQVRTRSELSRVVAGIEREPGIVLHALIDPEMTGELEERCRAAGCPSLSMLKLVADGQAVGSNSPYRSIVDLHLRTKSGFGLRLAAASFAAMLGLLALWILATELLRPALPYFPPDAAAAKVAAAFRDRAGAAASIGLVRGELWTDYAKTLMDFADWDRDPIATPEAAKLLRPAAERAARLAPHDSRAWLLLAAALWQRDRPDRQVADRQLADALRMSYYTGPSEPALMPLRLLIATRSSAAADAELQTLIGREIRAIVTRKPDLKPSIVAAYHGASPEGRQIIEATVGELDADLLTAFRATDRPGRLPPSESTLREPSRAGAAPTR